MAVLGMGCGDGMGLRDCGMRERWIQYRSENLIFVFWVLVLRLGTSVPGDMTHKSPSVFDLFFSRD